MTLLKWKVVVASSIILSFFLLFYLGNQSCMFQDCNKINALTSNNVNHFYQTVFVNNKTLPPVEDMLVDFDVEEDVLVFLHIQKTGGTYFGKELVKKLEVEPPCVCQRKKKKCECLTHSRKIWLFSRYSTGWSCGLHADWTELQTCVDRKMDEQERKHRKRNYHFITYLRDPVLRYLSEWKHVARGATWKNAKLMCNGRPATLEEVPFCYETGDWSDVSLEEFIACEHNLANNRQTRMLADLRLVNCYNKSGMTELSRNEAILNSAMNNLEKMSFFGITEYQNLSQQLFERTFDLTFSEDFEQRSVQKASKVDISQYYDRIKEKNALDLQLYEFAKKLFFARINKLNSSEPFVLN